MFGVGFRFVGSPDLDTTVNVNSVQEGTFPSGSTLDVNVTDGTDPVTPDAVIVTGNTIEIQVPAASTPVGATLMKTGQTTSYRTGDDGDLEAGRATSFSVLAVNNPFGNTNRFTDELGGQTYTNNIVIDWSTYDGSSVLGYRRTTNGSAVTWNDAVDGALAVSIGSFTTGWRLTNIRELMNLMNYEGGASFTQRLNYSPINLAENDLWTSTTLYGATTFAYQLTNSGTAFYYVTKISTFKYIPCRTFTVSGTTLS